MAEADLPFRVQPSDAEEISEADSPSILTETNARIKANPIADENPGSIVIGADTLVFLNGKALGKPADMEEALSMVSSLAGKTHEVITGVALFHKDAGLEHTFHVVSEVAFKPLSLEELKEYLELIEPLDKAGAYAAQEHGEKIIDGIKGPKSNVIGLPIESLTQILDSEPWCAHWKRDGHSSD